MCQSVMQYHGVNHWTAFLNLVGETFVTISVGILSFANKDYMLYLRF
jgi:hypothetical protein